MSEQRPEPLRKRVLQGSVYLTIRNGVSMLLSLVGSLFITRIIGPENYGIFNAAVGIMNYLHSLVAVSITAYLVRGQSSNYIKQFHLAFWWLLGAGCVGAIVASGGVVVASAVSRRQDDFVPIALSLFVWLPAVMLCTVPQALLERNLNYRALAAVQITAQVSTYLVAIPMAQLGFGAWALAGGFWLGQAVQVVGYFVVARYRPRWYWNRADWKQMMHYSISRTLSVWLYNLRELAPSVILFPLAGERAMGYYALADRLMRTMGFLYTAIGGVAFAAFARIQEDKARLTKAIQETIQYKIIFLGVVFSIFGACVGLLAAWMLGPKWDSFVIQQLCIVMASRVLLASVFGVQTQALYVIGQNWFKFRANLVYAVVLGATSLIFVNQSPVALAPLMFILADHIAHVPAYWYDIYGVHKYIGRIDYRLIVLWLLATQAALFAPLVSYWLYAAAVGILMHPLSVRGLVGIFQSLRDTYLQRGTT